VKEMLVWLYCFQQFQSRKSLRLRSEHSRSDPCPSGCPLSAICIIQFENHSVHMDESLTENRAKEHICLPCLDSLQIQSHFLHNPESKGKCRYNTFLCRTDH